LGDTSVHWLIAQLACETGIAPTALMQETDRMLYTMKMYLRWKATEQNKQQR
jgi:hypothetical protein